MPIGPYFVLKTLFLHFYHTPRLQQHMFITQQFIGPFPQVTTESDCVLKIFI